MPKNRPYPNETTQQFADRVKKTVGKPRGGNVFKNAALAGIKKGK